MLRKKSLSIIFSLLLCSKAMCMDMEIKYKSQKSQDKWIIQEVFQYKRNGFFVDMGAADGRNISNTYLLEKIFGWDGICIEANPGLFKQMTQLRDCTLVNCCVDYTNHTVDFRVNNALLGGIIADDTDNGGCSEESYLHGKKIGAIISCETRTLEQVLDECGAPKVIDYLSIDVEGAETRILCDFPFDKYVFLAMTVERPTPELNQILFKNGYVFIKNSQFDSFYVHESIENLDTIAKMPFEQVPPKNLRKKIKA